MTIVNHLMLRNEERSLSFEAALRLRRLPRLQRSAEKGGVILSQNELAEFSGRVISGMVSHFVDRRSKRPVITELNLPGEMFGIEGLGRLVPVPCSEFVAMAPSEVELVRHADILALLHDYPELTVPLWQASLSGMARREAWLVRVAMLNTSQRLAYLICDICRRLARLGEVRAGEFHMAVLQKEAAMMIGCSPVHAHRLISDLRDGGLIEWRGDRLRILDWRALARHGRFEGGTPTGLADQPGCRHADAATQPGTAARA